MTPALETTNLHYAYESSHPLRFPDISCQRGEQWLLLGPSGVGKTTLLHLLGGLLTPQSGTVRVGGADLGALRGGQLDHFRGRHIGIVFQRSHFIQSVTVFQNLALAQTLAGQGVDKARISTLLERLNIAHKAGKRPGQLSQGEQQRAAIARALINRPDVLLADEPTSALDDGHAGEVAALLREETQEAGATLVVVTHDSRLKDIFPRQILLSV